MTTYNFSEQQKRIVIEVTAGIPEYLVQIKKKFLFLNFWSTIKETKFPISKRLHFDNVEKAKSFIKSQIV